VFWTRTCGTYIYPLCSNYRRRELLNRDNSCILIGRIKSNVVCFVLYKFSFA
jgi:hypothetical protein